MRLRNKDHHLARCRQLQAVIVLAIVPKEIKNAIQCNFASAQMTSCHAIHYLVTLTLFRAEPLFTLLLVEAQIDVPNDKNLRNEFFSRFTTSDMQVINDFRRRFS